MYAVVDCISFVCIAAAVAALHVYARSNRLVESTEHCGNSVSLSVAFPLRPTPSIFLYLSSIIILWLIWNGNAAHQRASDKKYAYINIVTLSERNNRQIRNNDGRLPPYSQWKWMQTSSIQMAVLWWSWCAVHDNFYLISNAQMCDCVRVQGTKCYQQLKERFHENVALVYDRLIYFLFCFLFFFFVHVCVYFAHVGYYQRPLTISNYYYYFIIAKVTSNVFLTSKDDARLLSLLLWNDVILCYVWNVFEC